MASATSASAALQYLSERAEDAAEAVKGFVGAGASSTSSSRYTNVDESLVRSQLESDRDDQKLEGLRSVVAGLSSPGSSSMNASLLPSVLKLAASPNVEMRRLVYVILRRYAHRQPDVALLCINSLQRDLSDSSPMVRAMSLRVLSGLRVPVVASVVELAISRAIKDQSFYVRKVAALALVKVKPLIATSTLERFIRTLLQDRHPAVLACTLVAYRSSYWDSSSSVSSLDFALLHPHYRKLCHALTDMDEWGQQAALHVLGSYARRCLPPPPPVQEEAHIDRDLMLLITKAQDLLASRNAAVVTMAARLLMAVAPFKPFNLPISKALIHLVTSLSSLPEEIYVALLHCMLLLSWSNAHGEKTVTNAFTDEIDAFIPRSSFLEPGYAAIVKLQILVRLAPSSKVNARLALSELCEQASFHPNVDVARGAVDLIGQVYAHTEEAGACLDALLSLLDQRGAIVASVVGVIRRLLFLRQKQQQQQQEDQMTATIIAKLALLLFDGQRPPVVAAKMAAQGKRPKLVATKGTISQPAARAALYWMLGQYCRLTIKVKDQKGEVTTIATLAETVVADIVRRAALNFAKEVRLCALPRPMACRCELKLTS